MRLGSDFVIPIWTVTIPAQCVVWLRPLLAQCSLGDWLWSLYAISLNNLSQSGSVPYSFLSLSSFLSGFLFHSVVPFNPKHASS